MLIPGVLATLDRTKILFLSWRRSGVSASNHSMSCRKTPDTPFTASGVQVYRLHVLAVLWGNCETTSKVRRHNQRAQTLTVSFFSPLPPKFIQSLGSSQRIWHWPISEEAAVLASLCRAPGRDFAALRWYSLQLIQCAAKAECPGRYKWWHKPPGSFLLTLSYGSHTPLWILQERRDCVSQPTKVPCSFLSTLLLFSCLNFLFPYTLISTLSDFHLFFLNRQCQIFLSACNPAQIPAKGWIDSSVSCAGVNLYH